MQKLLAGGSGDAAGVYSRVRIPTCKAYRKILGTLVDRRSHEFRCGGRCTRSFTYRFWELKCLEKLQYLPGNLSGKVCLKMAYFDA